MVSDDGDEAGLGDLDSPAEEWTTVRRAEEDEDPNTYLASVLVEKEHVLEERIVSCVRTPSAEMRRSSSSRITHLDEGKSDCLSRGQEKRGDCRRARRVSMTSSSMCAGGDLQPSRRSAAEQRDSKR